MNKQQLQEIEALISKEIDKTHSTIADYKEMTKPIAPENAIGRLSRMDAINNKSVTEAVLRTAEDKLNRLKLVLKSVYDDNFGQCAKCGQAIPIQRI